MDRKSKTVFQLDTPYSEAGWPTVSVADQNTILELLVSLLSPIGQHRSTLAKPSKGKRSRKRKQEDTQDTAPPQPEISTHVLLGLNTVTRHLENIVNSGVPVVSPDLESAPHDPATPTQLGHVSAVFVARSSQPSVLHAHLSQLVAAASLKDPELPATRLVQLPKGCENQLTASLGIPRVGFLAITENAPHCKPLLEFIREVVPAVEAPWLKQIQNDQYQTVRINAVETPAPLEKKILNGGSKKQ